MNTYHSEEEGSRGKELPDDVDIPRSENNANIDEGVEETERDRTLMQRSIPREGEEEGRQEERRRGEEGKEKRISFILSFSITSSFSYSSAFLSWFSILNTS